MSAASSRHTWFDAQLIEDAARMPSTLQLIETLYAPLMANDLAAVRARRQRTRLCGLLFRACVLTVDGVLEDLRTLIESEAQIGSDGYGKARFSTVYRPFTVLGGLPEQFTDQYDVGFVYKFLATTVEVTARLATGWKPPYTVAEELALRIVLDQAESSADLYEVELRPAWREDLEAALFKGTRYETLDAVQSSAFSSVQPESMGRMAATRFENWFTPFDPAAPPSPYVCAGVFHLR